MRKCYHSHFSQLKSKSQVVIFDQGHLEVILNVLTSFDRLLDISDRKLAIFDRKLVIFTKNY